MMVDILGDEFVDQCMKCALSFKTDKNPPNPFIFGAFSSQISPLKNRAISAVYQVLIPSVQTAKLTKLKSLNTRRSWKIKVGM